jgi:hypothetical protein
LTVATDSNAGKLQACYKQHRPRGILLPALIRPTDRAQARSTADDAPAERTIRSDKRYHTPLNEETIQLAQLNEVDTQLNGLIRKLNYDTKLN